MQHTIVDLSPYYDNRGIQPPGTDGGFGFNIWRNTFPAEELPPPGSCVSVAGVPFVFPPRRVPAGDNLRCRGQLVTLPPGTYDWIYLLGAAERRTEDPVELHHVGGAVRGAWLRMSDFWPQTRARFGEPLAFRPASLRYPRHTQRDHAPSIWQQRIPVCAPWPLLAIRLPDNPAMHVFAMTLVADRESRNAR